MKAQNMKRLFLAAAAVLILLSVALCCLPVYRFQTVVYTKRSGNTFRGDERYQAARAEADAQAEEYRLRGITTEVTEEVIERVNSKGETTSLMIFRVSREIGVSGWDFIRTGFPSGRILIGMLVMEGLALAAAFATAGGETVLDSGRNVRRLTLKGAAGLMLAAAVLSVVFVLMTNVVIYRRIGTFAAGVAESPGEQVLAAADALIYQGAGGSETAALLKEATSRPAVTWWLQAPLLLGATLILVRISSGTIRKAVLRGLLYLFVIIMCALILYPFVVMFTSAFRTDADANDIYYLHLFPVEWHWENFSHILNRGVLRYLLNSLLLSSGATVLALACGIPAAYAMARMRFRGRKAFLGFVIMS